MTKHGNEITYHVLGVPLRTGSLIPGNEDDASAYRDADLVPRLMGGHSGGGRRGRLRPELRAASRTRRHFLGRITHDLPDAPPRTRSL